MAGVDAAMVQEAIQGQLIKVVEQCVDAELEHLEALEKMDSDDLDKLRDKRLADMKRHAKQVQEWKALGHGEYSELTEEKEFFEAGKVSKGIVCHFYKDGTPRCKIVDHHLRRLAPRHPEARFCKLNVERAPFLTERLRIRVIPTIALVAGSKTKDYIVGFTDLGNRDDFTTGVLEWRIAQSGAIKYSGDLSHPPDPEEEGDWEEVGSTKKVNPTQKYSSIRGGLDDDDDGLSD
ncbi:thioredoxin domain-containing protein 9 [Ischnura elegans]|uniref:thioredoxin domain-containing protein 9 n=1 Tax=Ischnura elegans TaxID=197161 RepID=UPI001ED8AAEF|nr:thioredoxin domain-containing protein 9 [Ischnura elegans]